MNTVTVEMIIWAFIASWNAVILIKSRRLLARQLEHLAITRGWLAEAKDLHNCPRCGHRLTSPPEVEGRP
jgi:hypothetical protein